VLLSKGLINSSKKMKMLNNLKRIFTLTSEELGYIKKYQCIYKRVLKEAKKRDSDRYVTEAANKTKAIWQLINRKIGKIQEDDHKLKLRLGNYINKNPIEITERRNMYFTNTVTELVQKHINTGSNNNACQIIKRCLKSIFISPVTEEEVVNLA
jgi:hypothetical protein